MPSLQKVIDAIDMIDKQHLDTVSYTHLGVDAHIDPTECTYFMRVSGEFVTSSWGNLGIAPYVRSIT